MLVSLICCVLNAVLGRHVDDPKFRRQRHAIQTTTYALVVYQVFAFPRFTTDHVQILNTLSMVTLYFYLETVCFALLKRYGNKDYRKPTVLLFYNHMIVFLVALYLYVNFVMGFRDAFFSWADYYVSYQKHYLTFFTRGVIIISLTIALLQLMVTVKRAERHYEAALQSEEIPHDDRHGSRALIASWNILSLILIVGQFVNLHAYQIAVSVAITAVDVYGTVYLVKAIQAESNGVPSGELSETHRALRQWLRTKPFPLQKGLTMNDIVSSTGISREELSHYVYDLQGLTFTAWVSDQRLDYCQHLLRSPDLSLSQIAYESGYGELAAMSKAFKKKYGVSPSAYRKKG